MLSVVDIIYQMELDRTLYTVLSGTYTMAEGARLCEGFGESLFLPKSDREFQFVVKYVNWMSNNIGHVIWIPFSVQFPSCTAPCCTMPHHAIPCRTMLGHPCCTIPHRTMAHRAAPCCTMPCRAKPCPAAPFHGAHYAARPRAMP